MSENIVIQRFDMSSLKPDAVVVILGARRTGKSTLQEDIFYHLQQHFSIGIALCPTDDARETMLKHVPSALVYDDYDEDAIKNIQYAQKRAKRKGNCRRAFIWMDDCMFDQKILKSKMMREIAMNGRHKKFFVVNAVQHCMDVPAAFRTNVDYVFALQESQNDNRERLHKYFFCVDSYKLFCSLFDKCTEGYKCMVLDKTLRTNDVTKKIFYYEANPNLPPYRLCDTVYWTLNNTYYQEPSIESAFRNDDVRLQKSKKRKKSKTVTDDDDEHEEDVQSVTIEIN